MNKVNKLNWLTQHYGAKFVRPFFACRSWEEIRSAFTHFEMQGLKWGIRTDLAWRDEQVNDLPFIKIASEEEAWKLWQKEGKWLVYIVYHSFEEPCCNGMAIRLEPEHVYFEYNNIDQLVSQREMYKFPHNLRQIIVGSQHSGHYYALGSMMPVFVPDDSIVRKLHFDRIYRLMLQNPEEYKIEFSVRLLTNQIITW
jgi:hypothetical protein